MVVRVFRSKSLSTYPPVASCEVKITDANVESTVDHAVSRCKVSDDFDRTRVDVADPEEDLPNEVDLCLDCQIETAIEVQNVV